jgi:hypothetical protein
MATMMNASLCRPKIFIGTGLAILDHPRERRSLRSRDHFNREAGPKHLLLETVSRFVGADGSH